MAEEIKTPIETQNEEPNDKGHEEVDYKAQLEQLMVEHAKLKKAFDKTASEATSYKKQLREKQSADEINLQEKAEREAEREERFKSMERELAINKLEKNFLSLGYNAEQALKSATAQYDGDTDLLFKMQAEVLQNAIKAKEAEWIKNRPQPSAGVGDEKTSVTQEQFNKFTYSQLVDFKNKYPNTYEKYMGR